LPDAAARRRATTDFATNLVVLAGAGTGKTSLLVERMLTAIVAGIAPITKLAAITFTDKAAGEMRKRLALGLDRLRALARGEAADDEPNEADRAFDYLVGEGGIPTRQIAGRALAALEELDQAKVTTIHGFCSELLHEHPVAAGVDPSFAVDSGEHAETVSRSCWKEFVARELGSGARRAELWKRLLSRLTLADVGVVARMLAGFHVPETLLRTPVTLPSLRELFGSQALALAAEIDALLDRQSGATDKTLAYFASVRKALEAFGRSDLDAFRERVEADPELVARFDRSAPAPNLRLSGVSPEEFEKVAGESFRLARALYSADDELAALLVEAIAPFALEFRETFLRQGHLSFDGLLALARNLLRDHPEVRCELKRRYRMLLVDEFQDTDPLQYEIVMFLAEKPDARARDALDAELEPGRLFVVGDAKQSIYRFRGADYGAYRRAVERIEECGGQSLYLVANFRSLRGVIDPVNHLFEASGGCWSASDYQPSYVRIEPVREDDGNPNGPAVELWTVELSEGALAEARREAEGQVIAREIGRLVDEGVCRYAEITILFRAFTRIAHYLRPLRQHGIPFVVDGGKDFLERPEVAQLMATLRTLAQPADQAALLAFLRSPAGGVADTELKEFADGGCHWNWQTRPSPQRFPLIASRFELLRSLARETRHLPADAVVRRVVERAQLLPLGAAAFEGAQRVANLRKLAAAGGELSRDGRLSLDEVVEALKAGRIANLETDPPLTDDASQAVRITSIHRMKGLENRWVILPDLARQEVRRGLESNRVEVARMPGERLALAVKASRTLNSTALWLERENELHGSAEETRVLYVALTRAKDRLVVVAGPSRREARWVTALSPWGYDPEQPPADGETLLGGKVLHRHLLPGAATTRPTPRLAHEDTRRAVRGFESAVEALHARARPPFAAPSGLEEEAGFASGRGSELLPRLAARRELGRAVGIVIHRLLAWWSGDEGDIDRLLSAFASSAARAEGVEEAELVGEVREILDGFLGSPLAREFLRVEIIGREVPMLLRREEGVTFRGSIDLLYRETDGVPVVADYKTDRETNEVVLRDRYREQLGVYSRAVQHALELSRRPRAELWLLRSGRRIAVDGP
jgi:ATP-dependent helicase/nuclease subunit A